MAGKVQSKTIFSGKFYAFFTPSDSFSIYANVYTINQKHKKIGSNSIDKEKPQSSQILESSLIWDYM
jgi:hypothetical protein